MLSAPQARFRIYTSPASYLNPLIWLLTNSTNQKDVIKETEIKISALTGKKHAIFTPTARTAIYLSLSALIKKGQKVILSPITIVDVINMVICAGGVPVFCDTEPNTCNIDANKIESLIDKDTGAVLITHLHGLMCDVVKIKDICKKHNIPLIEDAAQAFSTQVNGQWAGSFGTAGIFSFGMYKIVNAFFGGMIITDDDALNEKVRNQLRTFPILPAQQLLKKMAFAFATDLSTSPLPFSLLTYWILRYGYMNNIQALSSLVTVDRNPAIKRILPADYLVNIRPEQVRLIARQLDQVEKNNQRRIETARMYNEGLQGLKKIILPPAREDGSHIYTYYPVRITDRHAFMRFAFSQKRDLVLSHYHNTAALSIFREYARPCPVADQTARELVYLPTYPAYNKSEILKTIQTVRDYDRA